MYQILVRTSYRGTPIQQITVTVLNFKDKCSADDAYDSLLCTELKQELSKNFMTETVTKLY